MKDKTEKSNLDNDLPKESPENIPSSSSEAENKSSSTHPPIENDDTDQAVDEVVRHESDEVMAAEDSELARSFDPVKKPWYKKLFAKKKVWIPLAILLVLVLLTAIPFSRYKLLGLVWKQNVSLLIQDSQTHQPVSSVTVTLGSAHGVTDSDGKLTVRVPVGTATVTASKHYYKTATQKVLAPLRRSHTITVPIIATGRQVPVTVINKISQVPVANATVSADQTSVRTNVHGTATIVLPANKSIAAGTITATSSGYNSATVTIKISSTPGSANDFQLVPSGKVYFLSNASAKIDVVSTNLDGSDRQTVVAGTGSESSATTNLTHSADWKYLSLFTIRSSSTVDFGTLYAINAATGQLTTIQSGLQTYMNVIGWSTDDHLIYTANNATLKNWQSGGELLESYNPVTGKSTILDQTIGAGSSDSDYATQTIANEFILPNNTVLYTKHWIASFPTTTVDTTNKVIGLYTINANGTNMQTIKSFPTDFSTYLNLIENNSGDYYMSQENTSVRAYYEFTNGNLKVAPSSVNQQTFNNYFLGPNPIYYLSPDGTQTTWSAVHDGQGIIYSGDSNAGNATTLASLGSTYGAAGWYGSHYVLVEKNNSQLFIMPKTGLSGGLQLQKITDYFTPSGGR